MRGKRRHADHREAVILAEVANFGSILQKGQDALLEQVRRHMGTMAAMCKQHGGRILKHSGNWLLMQFDEGERALRCAVAIQEQLARAAGESDTGRLPQQTPQFRLGVYLGQPAAVRGTMGGAQPPLGSVVGHARTAAGARPGGLCVSRTTVGPDGAPMVTAAYLTPAELNELRAVPEAWDAWMHGLVGPPRRPVDSALQWGISVTAILLAASLVFSLATAKHARIAGAGPSVARVTGERQPGGPVGNVAPREVAPPVATLPATLPARVVPVAVSLPAASRPAPMPTSYAALTPATKARILIQRRIHLRSNDFQGMLDWLTANGLGESEAARPYAQLVRLRRSLQDLLGKTTASDPLKFVVTVDGEGVMYETWTAGGLKLRPPEGKPQDATLDSFDPEMMLSLARSALVRVDPVQRRELALAIETLSEEYRAAGLYDRQ